MERVVQRDLLGGGKEEVEIYEWWNSSLKGEKIEPFWEGKKS